MSVDYSLVGRRIKEKRKTLKKTQDDLAEALAVSVGYISQIERGATKVSLDTLSEIAGCLDSEIVDFLSDAVPARESYLSGELRRLFSGMSPAQRAMLLELAQVVAKYRP